MFIIENKNNWVQYSQYKIIVKEQANPKSYCTYDVLFVKF